MSTLRWIALVLGVFVAACTESPTRPQPQAPAPPATPVAAKLEVIGWWVTEGLPTPACAPNGDCQWADLLQNTGTGCASGTSVVIHLSSGADYPLDALGGGLAAKIIRPTEIVQLLSVQYVDSRQLASPATFVPEVKWNDVSCPAD